MEERFTAILERFLTLPLDSLRTALVHASDLLAAELKADKVDAFLYQPESDSLRAVGTSTQPLSLAQRRAGLDVLPVANGGRAVEVFQTGEPHLGSNTAEDPGELIGIREKLGVRSQLA